MPISAYLITKNEAKHLAAVLASLAGADEIVVVDSGSTDGTIEIARAAGARVIHQDWLGFARQKDFALRQCLHEWVLNMDGDEILSAGSMPLIRQAIDSGRAVGYRIARDDEFMGASMARSHCRPFLRVYRRDQAIWDLDKTVHEHIKVKGPHPVISGVTIHHKGYDSVTVYMDKLNRYAALKNVMWEKTGRAGSVPRVIAAFPLALFKHLFLRRMVLSGPRGFVRAMQDAFYVFLAEAMAYERTRRGR
ncbi:lipopolysaccharide core biosynthesis glycosyltransferase WaaE [Opitutia bacterium]|nr:lipopolysaccharide core biosynthesis glycosyltransferase WaaE [Opitutae bacterium]